MSSQVKKKMWGFISYRPRWGLAKRGWLTVLFAFSLSVVLVIWKLEPFLAYSQPVAADILVVEGWVGDDALKGAIAEFNRHSYRLLITTGIPLGRGEYLTEYKNFAHFSEASLISMGFDRHKIQAIPTPSVKRDRTLTSAIAVKEWLINNQLNVQKINVYSGDVHSRRSHMLYTKVFEPKIQVGAIAHPPLNYDPQWWWTSSEGVKTVISEAIAYVYAKLFIFK
ncbi:MAG: hypothetical protein Tsb0014_05750 [Pleurocapsa sp.]